MRMQNIYGAEYRRQYPDESLEKLAKREWGTDIAKWDRDQINNACTWIHRQKTNFADGWEFLDMGRCVGALKAANEVKAMHRQFQKDRALEAPGVRERSRKAGERELKNLKDIFG